LSAQRRGWICKKKKFEAVTMQEQGGQRAEGCSCPSSDKGPPELAQCSRPNPKRKMSLAPGKETGKGRNTWESTTKERHSGDTTRTAVGQQIPLRPATCAGTIEPRFLRMDATEAAFGFGNANYWVGQRADRSCERARAIITAQRSNQRQNQHCGCRVRGVLVCNRRTGEASNGVRE
jgi:hypothetical protein